MNLCTMQCIPLDTLWSVLEQPMDTMVLGTMELDTMGWVWVIMELDTMEWVWVIMGWVILGWVILEWDTMVWNIVQWVWDTMASGSMMTRVTTDWDTIPLAITLHCITAWFILHLSITT